MKSSPMQHLARLLAFATFLAALVGGGGEARADAAAAQALFDAARQLMAQGKYAEACPKLEESQRLDPGIGTQFNLASCYEQIGRTASAWSLFLEVAGAAKAAGQPEREKVARQRAAALEAKLIRLTITAPPDAPEDIQVKRDGALVGRAQWGIPVPVDPGQHVIEAVAPGRQPFTKTVELTTPGTSETVAIPPLRASSTAPPVATAPPTSPAMPPVAPRAPAVAGAPAPAAPPQMRRRSKGMMVTGIVLISVGAVAAVGGGLAIAAACPGDTCDDTEDTFLGYDEHGEPLYTSGYGGNDRTAEAAGIALVLGGLAGVAVGIPLAIIGGRRVPVRPNETAASAAPELVLGPRYAGLRWSM